MRAAHCIAALAIPLLAACGDAVPATAPTAAAPADAPVSATASANCSRTRTYYLDEIERVSPNTRVMLGHVTEGPDVSVGSLRYELIVTPTMFADLAASRSGGCLNEVRWRSQAFLGTLGAGVANYDVSTIALANRVGFITRTLKSVHEARSRPGCNDGAIGCSVSIDHVAFLQLPLNTGDVVSVSANGVAIADAIGDRTSDQAKASWTIPQGGGRHPDGPRVVIRKP